MGQCQYIDGAVIGEHCNICDGCYVERGAVIGEHVTLKNEVAVFDGVTLEDDVFVGAGVAFINDRNPRSHRKDAWILEKHWSKRGPPWGQCHGHVRGDHRELCGHRRRVCRDQRCSGAYDCCWKSCPVGRVCLLLRTHLDDELKCTCRASYQIKDNKIVPI